MIFVIAGLTTLLLAPFAILIMNRKKHSHMQSLEDALTVDAPTVYAPARLGMSISPITLSKPDDISYAIYNAIYKREVSDFYRKFYLHLSVFKSIEDFYNQPLTYCKQFGLPYTPICSSKGGYLALPNLLNSQQIEGGGQKASTVSPNVERTI